MYCSSQREITVLSSTARAPPLPRSCVMFAIVFESGTICP
eukprot:COSAG04_NODE_18363_length_444_cov_0.742029_1_plen_39_part_10